MIIVAHRGGAAEAPENTITAIQRAITHGIYHFEVDLRLSADDKLVLLHDNNLKRTTGIDRYIDEIDSRELAGIAVTEKCGLSGHIPLLSEVVQQCTPIRSIQLELKSDDRTDRQRLKQQVCHWLDEQASINNIVITSFDIELLRSIRRANSRVNIGVVNKHSVREALDDLASVNASYLCLNHKLLETPNREDRLALAQLHAMPCHLSVWTVNDRQQIDELKKFNVQSIISDVPTLFDTLDQ